MDGSIQDTKSNLFAIFRLSLQSKQIGFHILEPCICSDFAYLIRQNFGGLKCRKVGLLPKVLSAEKFSPPNEETHNILFGGQYGRNFKLVPNLAEEVGMS